MRVRQLTVKHYKSCLLGIGLTIIVFLIFQYVGFFKNLNDLLFDQYTIFSGEEAPDNRLIIIKEDDESANWFGTSSRTSHYTELIRRLPAFGTKTIAFDLLFIDEKDKRIDSLFAAATDSIGHVVHCFDFCDETIEYEDQKYEKYAIDLKAGTALNFVYAWNAKFPHKRFIDSFNLAGHITAESDYHGRFRRIPLFIEFEGSYYPALGIVTLLDFYGVTDSTIKIEKTFWGRKAVIETPDETIEIPINSRGQILLNFYGKFDRFESIPMHEALKLFDAIKPGNSSQLSLPMFNGKIALIGNTETAEDIVATPFSASFPGVGLHATLISNILQRNFITEVSWKVNAILTFILCVLLLAAFLYYLNASKSIWTFSAFAISLFVLFNLTAFFLLFDSPGIWLNLVQINSTYLFFFVALLFYDKGIRLKELNSKIAQLENNIFNKIVALDRLDQLINSQTEQYKITKYLADQLQTVLNDPASDQQGDLEKFFPKFFEEYGIMKENLEKEIQKLRFEKEKVFKEKEKLEHEKKLYENIVAGKMPGEQVQAPEKPKMNKVKQAQEVMAAWQNFQLQRKRSKPGVTSTSGIIAVTNIPDENGKIIKTELGEILEKIEKISSFDITVLITGEHGTGKGILANAIHEKSNRAHKQFVTVNCSAIPDNLMESELFGHERGAFTSAHAERKGKFEYADGGTIFLDEIGDLKLDLQAKLLRVLQEKEIEKIGSNKTIRIDARVIAATNKDLQERIKNKQFREDLYFRLNVVNLHVPPLRERVWDIPFLIQHFLNDLNKKYNMEKSFSSEAIIAAICYHWTGNIRELQHKVENVYALTTEKVIDLAALQDEIQAAYRDIFESEEVPLWSQIKETVQQEKGRLLEACKSAIKQNRIDEFLKSSNLQANHEVLPNCYEYFRILVDGMASIFPTDKRIDQVQLMIVQMQNQLLEWCRSQGLKKGDEIGKIEKILGRTRRQIDSWAKKLDGKMI